MSESEPVSDFEDARLRHSSSLRETRVRVRVKVRVRARFKVRVGFRVRVRVGRRQERGREESYWS